MHSRKLKIYEVDGAHWKILLSKLYISKNDFSMKKSVHLS